MSTTANRMMSVRSLQPPDYAESCAVRILAIMMRMARSGLSIIIVFMGLSRSKAARESSPRLVNKAFGLTFTNMIR